VRQRERDHINSLKNDHGPSYLSYRGLQRWRSSKNALREIFVAAPFFGFFNSIGHSRRSDCASSISGLPREADNYRAGPHLAFVPEAVITDLINSLPNAATSFAWARPSNDCWQFDYSGGTARLTISSRNLLSYRASNRGKLCNGYARAHNPEIRCVRLAALQTETQPTARKFRYDAIVRQRKIQICLKRSPGQAFEL